MAQDDTKKQDGKAIYAALTAFEGMPEREQPEEQQERDWASFDQEAEALSQAERQALIERAAGSLARDDGRDMTQELLDERRVEAEDKDW